MTGIPCSARKPQRSTSKPISMMQRPARFGAVAEVFPCCQEDFLNQVVNLVIPRREARTNVAIKVVSVPGNKFCCSLAILAQAARGQHLITARRPFRFSL